MDYSFKTKLDGRAIEVGYTVEDGEVFLGSVNVADDTWIDADWFCDKLQADWWEMACQDWHTTMQDAAEQRYGDRLEVA